MRPQDGGTGVPLHDGWGERDAAPLLAIGGLGCSRAPLQFRNEPGDHSSVKSSVGPFAPL